MKLLMLWHEAPSKYYNCFSGNIQSGTNIANLNTMLRKI